MGRTGLLLLGPDGAHVHEEPEQPATGHLRAGVLMPVMRTDGPWTRVLTPCERLVWVRDPGAEVIGGMVALDPGHGGDEPGAVGPSGLLEKELNLDVARRAAAALRAQDVKAVLTRPADYRATLAFRTAVADAMGASLVVSIHHNAEPDGRSSRPGTETYHQHASPHSRRLAGLLYEELSAALREAGGRDADWAANVDAGAKWRLNDWGEDYYGMLRRTAAVGIPACLTEFAFLSDPGDEALLLRSDVRQAEAEALARAVVRFLRTADTGSGFTTPVPRFRPAGTGGGLDGCLDPS
jgi:N-acetylmuramoyl-L-alanine amidase